tara:strand:- start:1547 stop:1735 length:189 start_codon:yes stop_codon:yes gene_type:complete
MKLREIIADKNKLDAYIEEYDNAAEVALCLSEIKEKYDSQFGMFRSFQHWKDMVGSWNQLYS